MADVSNRLPERFSLDEAFRAAYYVTEQYIALEPEPDEGLALFLQYMNSDPARWDDWQDAIRRALADGGAASPLASRPLISGSRELIRAHIRDRFAGWRLSRGALTVTGRHGLGGVRRLVWLCSDYGRIGLIDCVGGSVAVVNVYRSAGWAWAARAVAVEVDGSLAGTLRSKDRLRLQLEPGAHMFQARIGSTRSPKLQLDLTNDTPVVILAVRPMTITDRAAEPGSSALRLVQTDDYTDKGPTFREMFRDRPPIGYRKRTRTEQMLWVVALLLLFVGQIIRHTVSARIGAIISLPGIVVIVVLFFRLFIYRPNR